jgi:DNA (cytosine-5)-methyltransferase 1
MLENVAALLTRGLDRVCGTLAAVGYDAEWHCIPAAALGAPHIRDRIFILGYANSYSQSTSPVDAETPRLPDVDNADSPRRGESDKEMAERPSEQSNGASSNAGEIPDPISKPAWNQGRKACGQRREPARTLQPKTLRQRDGETMPERIKPICSNVPDPDREDSQRRIPNGEFDKEGREKPSSRFSTQCSVKRERDGDSEGTIKPELGRIINGLSGGLDRDLNFWKNGDWEKGVPRVTVKSPNRINRLKGLGNAVVPQVAEFIAIQIMENYFNATEETNSDPSL